jgi:SAM-dependent methyltransferase
MQRHPDPYEDSVLQEHYAQGAEDSRLSRGGGLLEFERTKELVLRHLPSPPATVADIGGGPGAYALWLASLGYCVEHRDIVEMHVEQLRTRIESGARVSTAVSDARWLDLADASVDAALLLGPLYHLTEQQDRIQALTELRRVLRPGGFAFIAAISRWSPRLNGIVGAKIYETLPHALGAIDEVERTGILPPLFPGSFAGFVHRPHELHAEIETGGFDVLGIVAIEGPAALLGDLDGRMRDARDREVLLNGLRALESVPEVVGATPHLLAIARRPA